MDITLTVLSFVFGIIAGGGFVLAIFAEEIKLGNQRIVLRKMADEYKQSKADFWKDKICFICGKAATTQAGSGNPRFYCSECWRNKNVTSDYSKSG